MKWLTYSGISVTITVNPAHWRLRPWANHFAGEWVGPHERRVNFGWLFLTVRAWLDDGCW